MWFEIKRQSDTSKKYSLSLSLSHTHTHTHTCTHRHVYTHTCTHTYTHVRVYTHTCTHTCARAHTHTHTHTHMFIYSLSFFMLCLSKTWNWKICTAWWNCFQLNTKVPLQQVQSRSPWRVIQNLSLLRITYLHNEVWVHLLHLFGDTGYIHPSHWTGDVDIGVSWHHCTTVTPWSVPIHDYA